MRYKIIRVNFCLLVEIPESNFLKQYIFYIQIYKLCTGVHQKLRVTFALKTVIGEIVYYNEL